MSFEVEIKLPQNADEGDAFPLRIRAHQAVLTRLVRIRTAEADDYLRAPPLHLAQWLVEHWWRLRGETMRLGRTADTWRIAHEMSSIGRGHSWPRLSIWSEGTRMLLMSRADPAGLAGPVQFTTNAILSVQAQDFENSAISFMRTIGERIRGAEADEFREQLGALESERADPEHAAWRLLEAALGFDPDDAPNKLMQSMCALAAAFDEDSIREAAQAHQGPSSAKALENEIEVTRKRGVECDLQSHAEIPKLLQRSKLPPWKLAEDAANQVRQAVKPVAGPVSDKFLASLLGVQVSVISDEPPGIPRYALRLQEQDSPLHRVTLRSKWRVGRRFELLRALGDTIWQQSGLLGPITRTSTSRQKFQRAFAQSFLCPFDELRAYLGTKRPSEEDIEAAARHFEVSAVFIKTMLVNKHILDRSTLENIEIDRVERDSSRDEVNVLLEAA